VVFPEPKKPVKMVAGINIKALSTNNKTQ